MNNISDIIVNKISNNKITEFYANCENIYGHSPDYYFEANNVCKKCSKIMCNMCINIKRNYCAICSFPKLNFLQKMYWFKCINCFNKIYYKMCCDCGKFVGSCDRWCRFSNSLPYCGEWVQCYDCQIGSIFGDPFGFEYQN